MKILVTGGSGMVGKYVQEIMPNALFPSSSELNLLDPHCTKEYLNKMKFTHVIHLAAHVGSLHDNIKNKINYFDNNIIMNTNITKYSYESGVKNFLGILSSCIYPDIAQNFPIKEDELHLGAPNEFLFSYAYAKRAHAVQINAYKDTFNVNYNYLIPCNLYGQVSNSHKGRSHYVNDLIFKIIQAKKNDEDHITLFGDGMPMRQFMHAKDLAKIVAHYVENDLGDSFNVATTEHYSVAKIAEIALSSCDADELYIKFDPSLPNGQLRKDVDIDKFRNFFPEYKFITLKDGIKEIYDFYRYK